METRRLILYAALAFVLYSLWTAWQVDYPQSVPQLAQDETSAPSLNANEAKLNVNPLLPDLDEQKSDEQKSVETSKHDNGSLSTSVQNNKPNLSGSSNADKFIHVKTDVLDVTIDTEQGDIVGAQLLDYPVSVDEKDSPTVLLTEQHSHRYTANSSLLEKGEKG